MAIIYTYPIKTTSANRDDLILISDSADKNKTKQISVAKLPGGIDFVGVGGNGTAGKIPKWSAQYDLTDSSISEDSVTGNIGIGTTSPDGLLHVSAGTQGDARLILEADTDNNDENDVPQIWFKADGGVTEGLIGLNNNFLDIMSNNSLQNGIRFFTGSTSNIGTTDPYTGATEKMRILPNGNVGIYNTAPAERLDVVGKTRSKGLIIYSTGGVNAGDTTVVFNNTLATKQFSIGSGIAQNTQSGFAIRNVTDSRTDVYVDDTGSVGIGTFTPSDGDLTIGTPKLHVAVAGTSGTFNLAARFQSTTTDADNTGTSILVNSSNDRGLLIKAGRGTGGDREVAYFDVVSSVGVTTNMLTMGRFGSVHNVGIGTTTPTSKLTVDGGDIEVDDSASGLILRSPDGTRYRVTVANGGTLSVAAV